MPREAGKPPSRRIGHLPLGIVVAALLVAGVAVLAGGSARHFFADLLGVRTKNEILAIYTLAMARPTQTDDLVPIANDSLSPYAVNVFLDQEVQTANVARTLDLVKAAGFRTIKQELLWSDVERPNKGEYQDQKVPGKSSWANYDRIVDLAQQRHLNVIFRIDTTPSWARPPDARTLPAPEKTPPEFDEDYGDFVAAVVRRYKGRVHDYQIWNEPNLASEWGGQAPDPAEYARLLRIADTRAKEVDPSVVILAAALAPTIQNDSQAMPDTSFLQKMYEAGAGRSFDVMSANAYGLRDGPNDWRLQQTNDVNFARPVLLREIMVRNGDAGKPIWASEIGWNSLPSNWSETHPKETPLWGSVSRALQAAYTVSAYQRAAEQWPWMGLMAVWHFRMVHPSDANTQQYYFDMVSVDWQAEPIYFALQRLMTSTPVLYRGYHQEDDWALAWSPGWEDVSDPRASLGHLKEAATNGSEVSFDLNANWLDLVVPTGPGWGKLAVTIDGLPFAANQLPIEHGQAILDLHGSVERWQVRRPIAAGLGPGVHHVQIRALSGRVGIDGIVADAFSPQENLYLSVLLGAIGLVVFGLTVWRRPPPAICPE
ncbi:MAG: cellulase family glycosylhydrolase [Chloroflexota bacterium]